MVRKRKSWSQSDKEEKSKQIKTKQKQFNLVALGKSLLPSGTRFTYRIVGLFRFGAHTSSSAQG